MRGVQIETKRELAAARLFIWSLAPHYLHCLHCLPLRLVSLFAKSKRSFSKTTSLFFPARRFCDHQVACLWLTMMEGFSSGGFSTDYIAAGQVSTLLCLYHFSDLPLTTVFAVLRLVMKPLTANYRGDHLIMFKLIPAWGFGLVLFAYPYISSLSPVRWWSVLSPLQFPSLAN